MSAWYNFCGVVHETVVVLKIGKIWHSQQKSALIYFLYFPFFSMKKVLRKCFPPCFRPTTLPRSLNKPPSVDVSSLFGAPNPPLVRRLKVGGDEGKDGAYADSAAGEGKNRRDRRIKKAGSKRR